ncbi:hypothetical protein [Streptomyces acidiscabies]|uniref:Uncharacterized protein n=1 Tax=Streptomyces acidiscabies TaxID=42234 RepID=A0A0L0KQ87_9ACTN|nr:hypothetical protein [Streptomyces acidiscabies]KND40001.1 hypothetical protein IQ63_01035 [Streptomyces acidiscabies]
MMEGGDWGDVMGISLGTRISAVLVAGAVAVVAVALQEGDTPRVRGGGAVPEASSSAVRSTPAVTSSPAPRTSALEGGTVGRSAPAPSAAPALPTPSPGRTPRVVSVSWLPPGPVSPDADRLADPDSVYDVLRSPARCREALGMIPGGELGDEWRVLKALAHACLAARGEGGSWAEASRPVRGVSCKGGAAQRVLGELLAYRRGARSGDSVRLVANSGGVPACSFGVRVVGGGEVAAGDVVRVQLRGIFFDFRELVAEGGAIVGRLRVPLFPAGDAVEFVVPEFAGPGREVVDVRVEYGGVRAVAEGALVVVREGGSGSPSPPVREPSPSAEEPGPSAGRPSASARWPTPSIKGPPSPAGSP